MSLFGGIGKALGGLAKSVGGALKKAAPVAAAFLPGPVGVLAGALTGGSQSQSRAPAPGLSPAKAAQLQAPVRPGGAISPAVGNGFNLGSLAQGGMSGLSQILGAVTGQTGGVRMKPGRITGNMIPYGFVEKIDPKTGQVYLGRPRRRRGISGRDLSTARRVVSQMRRFDKALSKRR